MRVEKTRPTPCPITLKGPRDVLLQVSNASTTFTIVAIVTRKRRRSVLGPLLFLKQTVVLVILVDPPRLHLQLTHLQPTHLQPHPPLSIHRQLTHLQPMCLLIIPHPLPEVTEILTSRPGRMNTLSTMDSAIWSSLRTQTLLMALVSIFNSVPSWFATGVTSVTPPSALAMISSSWKDRMISKINPCDTGTICSSDPMKPRLWVDSP
mmetsp:Transcript_37075/g.90118  ORF Transcript_37075/g.90118 Transcript_37075/m.90118 type:complete len:207 (-) Transcript_37075:592-1212(-)